MSSEEQRKARRGPTIVWVIYGVFLAVWVIAWCGFLIAFSQGSARAVMIGAVGVAAAVFGGLLYFDRRQGLRGETVRQNLARKGRQVLATGLVFAPFVLWFMWSIGAGFAYLMVAPVILSLITAVKGLDKVRCPRCRGNVGIRMAFHTAMWGIGGHYLETYCPACHVSLDEPRMGPRLPWVDE